MKNSLYYGDCLDVLRDFPAECVDLIYLDPPFNSKANYNVLFKSPEGEESGAQIEAFEDTWHWGEQSEREFEEILRHENTDVAEMMEAIRRFLGENDMMAYLTMMASRLLELCRVLKDSGSLYLHCDHTASHYLKIILDGVFGKLQFRNEVIWRRTGTHNKVKRFGPIHDTILYYSKSDRFTWNNPNKPYMKGHVDEFFIKDKKGYKTNYYGNVLTGSGTRNGESGMPWNNFDPTSKGRHWAIPGKLIEGLESEVEGMSQHEKLDYLFQKGLIKIEDGAAWPIYERYITPKDGTPVGDIWAFQPYTAGTVFGTEDGIDEDVRWLSTKAKERMGYPTQKPLGLLERIISASSNAEDVVLDPFCGCGTAIEAAQKLNRKWIGIDITHLAISLIENRIKDIPGIDYEVHGTPKDFEGAADLAERDKYQFEWWACSLVKAQPYKGKKKGADGGIDGLIWFQDEANGKPKKIIVSVKGGKNVGVGMIRDLNSVVDREKAAIGLFVTLSPPTRNMIKESTAAGFYKCEHNGKNYPKIQILTIDGLLQGVESPQYIDFSRGDLTIKKPKRKVESKEKQLKLM